MPAGVHRMGLGPAGLDPPADPPDRVPARKATTGRLYDVATRDYPLDSKGRARQEHALDTWVKLQLTIAQKSIPSDSEHGLGVAAIEHIVTTTKSRVENMVHSLMRPRVSSGDLKTIRLDVMTEGNRIGITYEYENLITRRPERASV
jgi:hypothetical protein